MARSPAVGLSKRSPARKAIPEPDRLVSTGGPMLRPAAASVCARMSAPWPCGVARISLTVPRRLRAVILARVDALGGAGQQRVGKSQQLINAGAAQAVM